MGNRDKASDKDKQVWLKARKLQTEDRIILRKEISYGKVKGLSQVKQDTRDNKEAVGREIIHAKIVG